MPFKICAFYCFFRDNKAWHFMWMPTLVSWTNTKHIFKLFCAAVMIGALWAKTLSKTFDYVSLVRCISYRHLLMTTLSKRRSLEMIFLDAKLWWTALWRNIHLVRTENKRSFIIVYFTMSRVTKHINNIKCFWNYLRVEKQVIVWYVIFSKTFLDVNILIKSTDSTGRSILSECRIG